LQGRFQLVGRALARFIDQVCCFSDQATRILDPRVRCMVSFLGRFEEGFTEAIDANLCLAGSFDSSRPAGVGRRVQRFQRAARLFHQPVASVRSERLEAIEGHFGCSIEAIGFAL
jgi:hypothetical protein